MLGKTKYGAIALLLFIVVAGCSREDPLVSGMRQEIKNNSGMLVGVIGDRRSFSEGGDIWTEYVVEVKKSDRLVSQPGTTLKVYHRGGAVLQTGPNGKQVIQQMSVDDGVVIPAEPQNEVFMVVRSEGGRMVVLDAVPIKAGQFAVDRPFNVLYKDVLPTLTS